VHRQRCLPGPEPEGRLGWTHPDIAGFLTGAGLAVLDIPTGLVPRALRDIQAGQAAGRFTVPDPEIALSAVTAGMLGLLRMRQRHPERVTEATVDQLAEADLRLLGVPADEAARLAALPSRTPARGNSRHDAAGRVPSATSGRRAERRPEGYRARRHTLACTDLAW
jgi:hypothetical protein